MKRFLLSLLVSSVLLSGATLAATTELITDGTNDIPVKDTGDAFSASEFNSIIDLLRGWSRNDNNTFLDQTDDKVGINGVTNPSEALDVNGRVKATFFLGDGSLLTGIDAGYWVQTGSDINYPTGNVGIGTAGPDAPLTIASLSAAEDGIRLYEGAVDSGGSESRLSARGLQLFFNNAATPRVDLGASAVGTGTGIAFSNEAWGSPDAQGAGMAMPAFRELGLYTANGTALVERMRIDRDGKVGIGISAPSQILHIVEDVDPSGGEALLRVENSTSANWSIGEKSAGIEFAQQGRTNAYIKTMHTRTGGDHSYEDAGLVFATGTGGAIPTLNDRMVITHDGLVGIGTTTPRSALSFGGSSPVISLATADGSDNGVLKFAGGGLASSTRGAVIQAFGNESTGNNGDLYLAAGDVGEVVVNGDVALGTTDEFYINDVAGTGKAFRAYTNAANEGFIYLGDNGHYLRTNGGQLALTASGSIPLYTPVVAQSFAGTVTRDMSNTATGGKRVQMRIDTKGIEFNDVSTDSTFRFKRNTGAVPFLIDADGEVGISQTNPQYDLDVTGDVNFTGTLYKDGTEYAGGKFVDGTPTATEAVYTAGNVGIGTVNPEQTLHVEGRAQIGSTSYAGQPRIEFKQDNHAGVVGWYVGSFGSNSDDFGIYGDEVDGAFGVYTNGVKRFNVSEFGNIDINGNMALGSSGTVAADTVLSIDKHFNIDDGSTYQLYSYTTHTSPALSQDSTSYGSYYQLVNNKTENGSFDSDAIGVRGYTRTTGTNTYRNNYGGYFEARNESTAGSGLGNLYGTYNLARHNSAAGNIGNTYGSYGAAIGKTGAAGSTTGSIAQSVGAYGATLAYNTDISDAYGVYGYTLTNDGYDGDIVNAYGVRGYVYDDSNDGGDITNAYGGYFTTAKRSTSPTMSFAAGINGRGSGAVTSYGATLYATDSAATTNTAAYVEASGASGSNIGIYGAAGDWLLYDPAGQVGLRDTTPDLDLVLDVEGKIGADQYCDENGANCTLAENLGGGKWQDGVGADEIYYSTANVGVGTTNPAQKLHVANASAGAANIRSSGPSSNQAWAGGIELTSDNGTTVNAKINASTNGMFFSYGGSEMMRIRSNGNVGIGTTNPSDLLDVESSTTTATLSLEGAGAGYTNAGIVLKATNGTNARGLGIFMHDAGGDTEWYAGTPYANADQYQIGRAASTAAHAGSVAQIANAFLTVKNDGDVGIGTNAPGYKLDINDDAASGAGLRVTGGGLGQPIAVFQRDVGSTGSMVVHAGGGDPQFYLNSGSDIYSVGVDGTSFKISDNASVGTNDRFVIDALGRVGIGTNSPVSGVHIKATTQGALRVTGAGNEPSLILDNADSNNPYIYWSGGSLMQGNGASGDLYVRAANDLYVQTGGPSTRMKIDGTTGNVGIGTSSPAYDLDVSGDINFTGDLLKNGVAFAGGKFVDGTDPNDAVYATGDVGIGIAVPFSGAKLHVASGTRSQGLTVDGVSPTIFLKETDGTANQNWQIRNSSGQLQIQQQNDAGTGSATRLTMNQDGDFDFVGRGAIGVGAGVADNQTLQVEEHPTVDASTYQVYSNVTATSPALTKDRTSYGGYFAMANNKTENGSFDSDGTGLFGLTYTSGTNTFGTNRGLYGYARNDSTAASGLGNLYGVDGYAYHNATSGAIGTAHGVYGHTTGDTGAGGTSTIGTGSGVYGTMTANESAVTHAYGVYGQASTTNGDQGSIANAYGVRGYISHDSDDGATMTNAYGGYFSTRKRSGAGNINKAIGVYSNADAATTAYGATIYADDPAATDNYGVYIEAENASNNNYALYVQAGDIAFPSGSTMRTITGEMACAAGEVMTGFDTGGIKCRDVQDVIAESDIVYQ